MLRRSPQTTRPRTTRLAVGVAGLLLATSGCSLGSDAFNENFPGDQPQTQPRQVIRTPTAVTGEVLPYETPPLVVPLPGPTGGVPGPEGQTGLEPEDPERSVDDTPLQGDEDIAGVSDDQAPVDEAPAEDSVVGQ